MTTRHDARDDRRGRTVGGGVARAREWVSRSWSQGILVAGVWSTLLTVGLLGPALRSGFTLSYDMVFVPRQTLLPQSLGVGGGLPRAVPQDAVIAILSLVVDGAWLQHAILLAIGVMAGIGVARLVMGAGRGAQVVAATLAIWNPFVVERLVQGHWALLWAYALTPWAVHTAIRVRRSGRGVSTVIVWCAAAALVPSGGLLTAAVAIPIALSARSITLGRRMLLLGGAIAVNLPWIAPAILHAASGAADEAGATVFALRSEGPWGPIITALGGGGLWNAEAVPASRGTALAVILTILVWGAAVAGWPTGVRLLGRASVLWWSALAALGIVLASASALAPQTWAGLISALPGGGLARDAQKLLAPLALLLAVLAGLGAARLWTRIGDRITRRTMIAGAVLLPMAFLPDAAFGVGGRLSAVEYPPQWHQMREVLRADPRSGDVIILPWSAFRRFEFNDSRTLLDPAPRWLTRPSISADDLPISRSGDIVTVTGDDPRAERITGVIESGSPLVTVMPELGARWVLVEIGQVPEVEPSVLRGLVEQWRSGDLVVWQIPDDSPEATDIQSPGWPEGSAAVIAIDAAVVVGLLCLVLANIARQVGRRRRHRP